MEFEEVRKKTGRPEYSFYLTEGGQESLPKDYALLLGSMITEIAGLRVGDIQGKDGEQVLELVFERLSADAWDQYRDQVKDKDLPARLAVLTTLLDERDFYPETQIVDGTLRIKLMNCPFRSVALKNDSVCTFDSHLMSAMLDIDVERQSCIHDGDAGCVYSGEVVDRDAEMVVAAIER